MKFRKATDPNSNVSGDSRVYTSIVSADVENNYLPLHLDASTIKIESRSTGLEPNHQDEGILLYTNAGAGSTIGLENVFGENADAIKLDAKKGGIKLNAGGDVDIDASGAMSLDAAGAMTLDAADQLSLQGANASINIGTTNGIEMAGNVKLDDALEVGGIAEIKGALTVDGLSPTYCHYCSRYNRVRRWQIWS